MVTSNLQSGRVRQRRRFTTVPTTASVSWLLSAPETQLFEGWFEHVLISGTLPFECPLKTPLGLENYQANFADIYSGPVLVGVDHWRFTANLQLIRRPLVDAEWVLIAPEYILMSSIVDRAVNKDWPQL
jgi:hypothetical protein